MDASGAGFQLGQQARHAVAAEQQSAGHHEQPLGDQNRARKRRDSLDLEHSPHRSKRRSSAASDLLQQAGASSPQIAEASVPQQAGGQSEQGQQKENDADSVDKALEDFDNFREAIRGPKHRQGRQFAPVWMQLKFMQLLPSPLVRPRPVQLPLLQDDGVLAVSSPVEHPESVSCEVVSDRLDTSKTPASQAALLCQQSGYEWTPMEGVPERPLALARSQARLAWGARTPACTPMEAPRVRSTRSASRESLRLQRDIAQLPTSVERLHYIQAEHEQVEDLGPETPSDAAIGQSEPSQHTRQDAGTQQPLTPASGPQPLHDHPDALSSPSQTPAGDFFPAEDTAIDGPASLQDALPHDICSHDLLPGRKGDGAGAAAEASAPKCNKAGRTAPLNAHLRRSIQGRKSLAGDGLRQEEDGRRHSTRLRRPPLAWFRNEHKIYTRAHRALPTVSTYVTNTPNTPWKFEDGARKLKTRNAA
ncbi:hypothetical protein WJX73_000942 [Symbiochloris irregularis]|uniref:Uncharacterized protein n=1 Tax=Symbiochloris irregularis TaxID=706552 RepID=A0AAW1PIP1_9CHLO